MAPNALYSVANLGPAETGSPKNSVIYVGRLVQEKKVDLLIRAFALAGMESTRLKIVGQGEELESLRTLASRLGCAERVDFLGPIGEPQKLGDVYSDAICSVSPGYVGLSLTQSLGFGVPMLIADNEPHAPEVELERYGGVARFTEDDPGSLADLLRNVYAGVHKFPKPEELAAPIKASYSAESMARGLLDSLRNQPQALDATGWPES
ncbi:glycosyltransferase [Arthrobacter sp. Leaf141]|uniref:glycosyltransferase n=1 Tax=Arthrobacter sp. Leaf141 TaxID=1736273 RepID=UPI00138F54CE|nr:glycosyltransferase [Arthrobacter sp. Leaf141]